MLSHPNRWACDKKPNRGRLSLDTLSLTAAAFGAPATAAPADIARWAMRLHPAADANDAHHAGMLPNPCDGAAEAPRKLATASMLTRKHLALIPARPRNHRRQSRQLPTWCCEEPLQQKPFTDGGLKMWQIRVKNSAARIGHIAVANWCHVSHIFTYIHAPIRDVMICLPRPTNPTAPNPTANPQIQKVEHGQRKTANTLHCMIKTFPPGSIRSQIQSGPLHLIPP